jgi:uncharacterized membrane protein YccC
VSKKVKNEKKSQQTHTKSRKNDKLSRASCLHQRRLSLHNFSTTTYRALIQPLRHTYTPACVLPYFGSQNKTKTKQREKQQQQKRQAKKEIKKKKTFSSLSIQQLSRNQRHLCHAGRFVEAFPST